MVPARGCPRSSKFAPGAANLVTQDEESSGILDISGLAGKKGTFAFDAQAHRSNPDPELVEEGQLLTMTVQSWGQIYKIKG